MARWNGSSRVTVSGDGACRARIAPRDLSVLRRALGFPGAVPAELATDVEGAFRQALVLFQCDDEPAAADVLEAESDTAVFVRPPHALRSTRIVYAVAIGAAAGFLIVHLVARYLGMP